MNESSDSEQFEDPDVDDMPDITHWLHDTTTSDEDNLEMLSDDFYALKLAMFNAFLGTPREKMKKMRAAIHKSYNIDIGDPTRYGPQLLDEIVGDSINSIRIDCCISKCMAYTGQFTLLTACPTCNTKRYDSTGEPRCVFHYIPLQHRLKIQFGNPLRSRQLSTYRSKFKTSSLSRSNRNDVFDGDWFHECCRENLFYDDRHLALRLTLDAVGLVKNPRPSQSITPVVIYILNLDPSIRDKDPNALTTHIIPGGYNHKFVDTWLQPLVDELRELHDGIPAYDGARNQSFVLKAHVILVTGDGPAIAEVMGTKSPGKSKQSCRLCTFSGTKGRHGKYFYPHNNNEVTGINAGLREQIERFERIRRNGIKASNLARMTRDLGITRRSILLDLPTIYFP